MNNVLSTAIGVTCTGRAVPILVTTFIRRRSMGLLLCIALAALAFLSWWYWTS